MKSDHRQALGQKGEVLSASFLEDLGYSILETNYRTPYGEIDLITRQNDVIVFVEVKTRSSRTLGPPEISITPRKAEHMRCAAEFYIQQLSKTQIDWRIDVIAVQINSDGTPPSIEHFENVIN
jgi:putative endonuclease